MIIGEQVIAKTSNLFDPYILGSSDAGVLLEVQAKSKGTVFEIKKRNKWGHTVGVNFRFNDKLGKERNVKLWVNPRNLGTITQ